MTETAETLDGHNLSWGNVHLADTIVDRHTGAHEWSHLNGVTVSGQSDSSFGTEKAILGVYIKKWRSRRTG